MRDYIYEPDDAPPHPIAAMSTTDIECVLSAGFEIVRPDHPTETAENIRDRLLLELFIREKGLRNDE